MGFSRQEYLSGLPFSSPTSRCEFGELQNIKDKDKNLKEVRGKKLVSFNFKGKIYMENTFISMLTKMITLLNHENPEVLQKLADSKFNFRPTSGCVKQRRPHLSRDPKDLTASLEIDKGIFVETNLSSQSIMRFLKSLLQQYQINKEEFSIDVIADDDGDAEDEQDTDE